MRRIRKAKDAYEYVKHFFLNEGKEEKIVMLYMKDDGTILGWNDNTDNNVMISVGSILYAQKAILVTNHSTGSSLPEERDINQTVKIKELLGAAKIGLTDHIIVGYKEFFSYAEERITFTN